MTATTPEFTIVPANEASWEDLQAVLGRGYLSSYPGGGLDGCYLGDRFC